MIRRSELVGKPVAQRLAQANSTVTAMCHSPDVDLAAETLSADVLVVAAGRAALVTADMVKVGAAVVDVGQNKTEAGLVDVDAASAENARA